MKSHGIVTGTIHRSFSRARKTAEIFSYFAGPKGAGRAERFWSHVEKREQDECWPWLRSTKRGYGRFKLTPLAAANANRVAWALDNGRDPGDMVVRHKCDNPICCNPAHLELGTHADNMADKTARGRWRGGDQAGVKNPRALLTEDHVAEIVKRFRLGQTNTEIARHVPIGHSMVSKIRVGLMWKEQAAALGWVPNPQFRRTTPEAEIARLGGGA
jgi:hypothetical protein